MPGLTVTEKEHWKDRLAKRIERKIEVLKASDPGLFTRLNREAREILEHVGLGGLDPSRLIRTLGVGQQQLVERLAPTHIVVPSGSRRPISGSRNRRRERTMPATRRRFSLRWGGAGTW